MISRSDFFAVLERVYQAAETLPRPEPGDIRDVDSYRFCAVRRTASDGREFYQWELAGPGGYLTGVTFGHWLAH